MRSFFRSAVPLALLLLLSGCSMWHGRAVPQPSAGEIPSPVRVHLVDGSSATVWQARVAADSLTGETRERGGVRGRYAVPLAQVERMDSRGLDFVATAGLTALVTVVLGTLALVLVYATQAGG